MFTKNSKQTPIFREFYGAVSSTIFPPSHRTNQLRSSKTNTHQHPPKWLTMFARFDYKLVRAALIRVTSLNIHFSALSLFLNLREQLILRSRKFDWDRRCAYWSVRRSQSKAAWRSTCIYNGTWSPCTFGAKHAFSMRSQPDSSSPIKNLEEWTAPRHRHTLERIGESYIVLSFLRPRSRLVVV